jgi:hypothetical protein
MMVFAVGAGLGLGVVAHAEDRVNPQLAVEAGAGYAWYANGAVADLAEAGVGWDVRLVLGAHAPLAAEFAYVGTANSVAGISSMRLSKGTCG